MVVLEFHGKRLLHAYGSSEGFFFFQIPKLSSISRQSKVVSLAVPRTFHTIHGAGREGKGYIFSVVDVFSRDLTLQKKGPLGKSVKSCHFQLYHIF